MAVKLIFGDPVTVAAGLTYEEAGWGPYQFPILKHLEDGNLAISYHVVMDEAFDYGKEKGWAVSKDNGKTWQEVSTEELPAIKMQFGTKLPSGKYLRHEECYPTVISEELYAQLEATVPQECRERDKVESYGLLTVDLKNVPDGVIPKYKWPFVISDLASGNREKFYSELDFPGMRTTLVKHRNNQIVTPMFNGKLRVAPDGSLWAMCYNYARPDYEAADPSYYTSYFLQSKHEGRSFQLKSWVVYPKDKLKDVKYFDVNCTSEGFCEPDMEFMPDGSIIALLRTGDFCPSYFVRSTDGGNSWSEPVLFDRCGVWPQLLHLECGVTLASYGRPGRIIRATEDPAGMQWDEPCQLYPYDASCNSCFYTGLLSLDDHTALLAYSDWSRNAEGEKRKTIYVRTITVEK